MNAHDGFGVPVSTGPCPDCDAEVRMIDLDGLSVAAIFHDDTCPQARAKEHP